MSQGKYEATDTGAPKGRNLSPLFGNIMLSKLDYESDKIHLDFVYINWSCERLV